MHTSLYLGFHTNGLSLLMSARGKATDIFGQKFGRLTVVRDSGQRRGGAVVLECLCECGNLFLVPARSLKSGNTRSCGCLWRGDKLKHGLASSKEPKTVEYNAWKAVNNRCHNQNNPQYKDYGGRGISVCKEWRGSFPAFLAYIGKRPSPKMSLDRIDVNGNYEPGNVRWADGKTQKRNMRSNVLLTLNGKTQPLSAWAEELGIHYGTLYMRKVTMGWSDEKALTAPIREWP